MEIKIEIYETHSEKSPFIDWIDGLKEIHTRAKIFTRLDRLKMGNFGDCKSVGNGIYELRIHYGPGVRIYYSKIGMKVILLLCGGDKSSQKKDIKNAKMFLEDYKDRKD
ncbi:type II toxin-antitoxin system RelE/ParE family toxin [Candidatus Neptunichlamydia sp. REUL1]|uniref:type II toxin-antitoxin system RelE/ParE family toxin n=1 Tax=Candidatus Neptunichlamydia sp. REUL1 TaxID=3064277 RepID=UPI00292E921C|nr:type II toxin-antitoxin system RelE/ParE family toxin [Candidatus Neptunochlamydia sp. REUL1]